MSEEHTERKIVGRRGRPRRDAEITPVVTNWQTDIITDRDPDYVYQFFLESEVRTKSRSSRIQLNDFAAGDSEVHDIPGWEVCHRESGDEALAGFRPDEGKPIDTVLRHGPHVAMKIRREHWDLLQRAQEQRADSYDQRLGTSTTQDFDASGSPRAGSGAHVAPGNVRINQKPLARI